jgi:hypothetical protein
MRHFQCSPPYPPPPTIGAVLQVGNLHGALAAVESRTHFGAWCIVSSPLTLGMDLSNETTMASVWPYVSNVEALQVNQRWAGDPGRLLNLSGGRPDSIGSNGGVEVWAKLQPHGAVALLAINTAASGNPSAEVSVDLFQAWPAAPAGWCHESQPCSIRDIWKQEDVRHTTDGSWRAPRLSPHDSAFVLISSAN